MQTDQSRTIFTLADGAGHTLVSEAGSNQSNEVRARDGGRYGDFTGLPAVAGKPVHIGFDGGRLSSDAALCCWPRSSSA
jgi:hypothetical protein